MSDYTEADLARAEEAFPERGRATHIMVAHLIASVRTEAHKLRTDRQLAEVSGWEKGYDYGRRAGLKQALELVTDLRSDAITDAQADNEPAIKDERNEWVHDLNRLCERIRALAEKTAAGADAPEPKGGV